MAAKLVGLSLSFCVREIAQGKVPFEDVAFLSTGTCIATPDDLEFVIADYRRTYWRDCGDEAARITRILFNEGRVLQPKLEGQTPLFAHHSRTQAMNEALERGTLPDYWLAWEGH